ncbi:MAG: NADP-dependent malic enzyme [Candidatus Shapirobacteria bacterium]|jgi:malate dehydrogenase (oxaloacetate-decarboxylating)|nr:NADP-dependent malic enzyme [Candidatus Shapirobacteria bacterium]
MNYSQTSIEKHKKFKGKIAVVSKFGEIKSKDDLSVAYTPGVAAVSILLSKQPELASEYSIKGNTVAVVSDGSAVLGLGNIGPYGALPVMEGKVLLFKEFANIDAFPIVLDTQDPDEIINIVKNIAPGFGGINLEDFNAPKCFYIEEKLKEILNIPVMHDDQHGTAIVVLAALINSLKLSHRNVETTKVLICGAGAAGSAVAKLLHLYGFKHIMMVDSKGSICRQRTDLCEAKKSYLEFINQQNIEGELATVIKDQDVFIGVSQPNLVTADMVKSMADKPIIFALANPISEIDPNLAKESGAFIVGTGRSDFPNQINNVLAFPGVFRGALDHHVSKITDEMKIAAAVALANYVKENELNVNHILPSPLDKGVVNIIAAAVKN